VDLPDDQFLDLRSPRRAVGLGMNKEFGDALESLVKYLPRK
jgi:hypothetical protein